MKKRVTGGAVVFAAVLLVLACGMDKLTGSFNYIEYRLSGTWERTEAAFWPEGQNTTSKKGTLVIGFDTVKISGPVAHLGGYTRDTTLEAYTKDGKLYIKDKGVWQSPLTYTLWDSADPYPYNKRLTLQGGGVVDETLKWTDD